MSKVILTDVEPSDNAWNVINRIHSNGSEEGIKLNIEIIGSKVEFVSNVAGMVLQEDLNVLMEKHDKFWSSSSLHSLEHLPNT